MSEYSLNVDTVGYPLTVVDGTILTLSLDTVQYPLTVVDGNQLTLSLNGATGPSGPAGANGAAGPNQVNLSTSTSLTGYIYGDGEAIEGATAASENADADTLALRSAGGELKGSILYCTGYGASYNGVLQLYDSITNDYAAIVSEDNLTGIYPADPNHGAVQFAHSPNPFSASLAFQNSTTENYYFPADGGTLLANTGNLAGLTSLPTARTYIGLGTGDSPTFQGLTLTSGSLTASTPNTITQTWNAVGTTFTAAKINALGNATSSASSLLLDLQLDSVSKFKVSKQGGVYASEGQLSTGAGFRFVGTSHGFYVPGVGDASLYAAINGNAVAEFRESGLSLSGKSLSWGSVGGSQTLFLTQKAAASLRLGAADAAASSAVVTSTFGSDLINWASHGLTTGCAVSFSNSGGALFGGVTANVLYYVVVISTGTFKLAATYAAAIATVPTVIDITNDGSGTNTAKAATIYQSLNVQNYTGTDVVGSPMVINGSQGTGLGAGGPIVFRTSPASGSSSATQNALATALTIDSSNTLTIGAYTGLTGGLVLNQSNLSSRITWVQSNSVFVFSPSNNPMVYNVGSGHLYVNRIQIGGGVSTSNWSANGPAVLEIDAANILAQRNGGAAQTSRIYTTYTSATDYARLSISAQSDRNRIASEAQTQTVKPLEQTFYTSASDPTTSNITDGAFGMWKNSGTGLLKLWANDGGTMKSIVLT